MKKIISIILLILATVNMTNAEELAFRGISLKNKKTAANIEAQLKSKGYKFYGYESGLKLFHGSWAAREAFVFCYNGYDETPSPNDPIASINVLIVQGSYSQAMTTWEEMMEALTRRYGKPVSSWNYFQENIDNYMNDYQKSIEYNQGRMNFYSLWKDERTETRLEMKLLPGILVVRYYDYDQLGKIRMERAKKAVEDF